MKSVSRAVALVAYALAFCASLGAASAFACRRGDFACPVLLQLPPGGSVIKATGSVDIGHDYYVKFFGKADQTINVNAWGGGLKHIGYPLYGPNGQLTDLDVFDDKPVTLPQTGFYVIGFFANPMGEGPFGRFDMTLDFHCWKGAEACPVLLKMKPGASAMTATGTVSDRRDYHFKFFAKEGQMMVIHSTGAALNPGFSVDGPNGFFGVAADNKGFTLPATGAYVIGFSANYEGERGRFDMTLAIK